MPSMRLNILSDLHLSQADLPYPETDADVVVLAGDLARPERAIEWAKGIDQPVVYVPGNHEFYGDSLQATVSRLQVLADGTNIHVLDRQTLVLGGVRFLGATLWTDFRIHGDGDKRAEAVAVALKLNRDFSAILSDEQPGTTFTPEESTDVFARDRDWLAGQLAMPFDGPTVVVTHHAPSPRSIHPRFAGSPANACFVSDLEYLMDGERVAVWIHGHTHDSFDYVVHGTRVLCNARGYHRNGADENAVFDAGLVMELRNGMAGATVPDRGLAGE